jgi:hypothetical protein
MLVQATLEEIDFKKNPIDPLIFNLNGKDQCTIILNVDDLMITSKNKKNIDLVLEKLLVMYKDLSIHEGLQHNYLGCHYDFSKEGEVKKERKS